MSNLTQSERDGLNELFCHLRVANMPLYKRVLLRLNRIALSLKIKIVRIR
ncbi:MAG: hypothetical protein L3J42_01820 [Hydrogenimonas sp.]|nr:hypothetical protein [Hydrogenimonas sp.]